MKNVNDCFDDRIVEIDIAKGICILLMVIGHSGMTNIVHHMIYAFHMPFFFFVSGVTTNVEKSFRDFTISKVKGLLVPFFIYYLIHVPCYAYLYHMSVTEYFYSELYNRIDGALWFIPILFLSQIINRFIPRHIFIEVVSVLILASVSSLLCIEGMKLPWNLSSLGFAASFVLLGRILSLGGAKSIFSSNISTYKLLIDIFITSLLLLVIASRFQLAMSFDKLSPILPIMVGALTGICCVLLLSALIQRGCQILSQFFAYTGVNTFVFIGFSEFVLKYENLYIRELVLIKYVILFLSLYTIVYIKNKMPWAKALRL